GPEYLRVDSERLMDRVMHAESIEQIAHQPARRKYHIEALVQPAHVASERPLAHPAANAAADDPRQVGVIERREWNAAAARDPPGDPRRMEGVAGLDQVRLQRV